MTLKEYCQIHGGSDMLHALAQNLDRSLHREIQLFASKQRTTMEIDKKFASMSYDIIFNFMKFCSKNRVDATDVKTL